MRLASWAHRSIASRPGAIRDVRQAASLLARPRTILLAIEVCAFRLVAGGLPGAMIDAAKNLVRLEVAMAVLAPPRFSFRILGYALGAIALGAVASIALINASGSEAAPQAVQQAGRQAAPKLTVRSTVVQSGDPIIMDGTGFPAGVRVRVYLGPAQAGAVSAVYGEGTTTADGSVTLSFRLPATWPNGERISGEHLTLVAATDDFRYRATSRLELLSQLD